MNVAEYQVKDMAMENSGRIGINRLAAMGMEQDDVAGRMAEIDREWDREQAVELGSAVLALAGTALGLLVNRRWFALTALAAAFLAQHSIQRSSPLGEAFRKLGFRSRRDIDRERYALKAQRGDFNGRPSR
ncbi:MAG TPA: hypothetical protein VGB46_08020 [Flavisolibacter sp.]